MSPSPTSPAATDPARPEPADEEIEQGSGPRQKRPSFDVPVFVDEDDDEAPTAAWELTIGRIGRYDLLGLLAVGGMAEVFLARERMSAGSERYVVVKLVRPHLEDDAKFGELFLSEGRVATQLAHPHICHLYEFGKAGDRYFIAMEWVNGETLLKMCERSRQARVPIPVPVLLRIFADVAEALDFAHKLTDSRGRPVGIVHRDVTPHNIMVSYDGAVKLLDFGVAKERNKDATEKGTIKGKFSYVSPEQVAGRPVDGRSDVFSLGVSLYEALSGLPPFRRSSDYDTLRAVLNDPVPPLMLGGDAALESALDAVIQRATAKDPNHRYQSASEMQEALEGILLDSRTVVLASNVARTMRTLFAKEIDAGPVLNRDESTRQRLIGILEQATPPVIAPAATLPPPPSLTPSSPEIEPRAPSRGPWLLVGAAGLLVGGIVAGLALAFAGGGAPADPAPPAEVVRTVPPVEPPPVEPAITPPTTPPPVEAEASPPESPTEASTEPASEEEGPSRAPRRRRTRANRSAGGLAVDPGF